MFSKKLRSIYLDKNKEHQSFRGELFNTSQLGEYARMLAREQQIGPGTKNNYLRNRLDDNEEQLHSYNTEVISEKNPRYISPATEWLVDNFYLIEEHIQLARHHFPKSYNKELPTLQDDPYKGLPRIYGITVEYISHVDAQVDEESLTAFYRAYQEVSPLKLGELWAIPIMLRLILIENLRRIVTRLGQDKKDRDLANKWMDKVEEVNQKTPSSLIEVVSDMARAVLPFSTAFVSAFSKRLSDQNTSMRIVKNWFEQRLHEEGLSAEELIQAESQTQAADQLSVSHSIKSFRFINSTDWRNFVEKISFVEYILRGDPMQLYAAMDFNSRDQYRHRVEKLARQSHYSEEEVARRAIEMTQDAYRREGVEKRATHVGYYLIDEGSDQLATTLGVKRSRRARLARFLKTYPLVFYTGTILLISILGTLLFAHLVKNSGAPITYGNLILVSICFFFFLSQFSVFLVNYLSTLLVPPDFLPRLDFSSGIPRSCRTIFVVPAMISDKDGVSKLLTDIEIHYLSNPDSSLTFALLTDFTDSDNQQEPRDNELLEQIRSGIESLNRKYGSDNNSLFFLFHRPRQWDAAEKKWMAYERKRGKLMAFNTFLTEGITTPFMLTEGNLETLTDIKYVITLDADTQLPPYSAYKLVGTMAHILNQPVIDPDRHIVTKGYGILQPRVAINLRSSLFSWYSRLFTNEVGIDPYTRSVSDVYQDIFHAGSFVGKGIYDVKTFETVLARRFPENRILSHDLLESTYVRSGLLADVEMYESYPATYVADAKRRHRWMRGDWQIVQWLSSKVPTLTGKEKNPLSGLSKWKIADNLRRTLVSPLALLFLTGAFAWFPRKAWIAVIVLLIVAFLPFFITFPVSLFRKSKEEPWLLHFRNVLEKGLHQLKQTLFSIALFPYEAYLCADAIIRSLWRLTVTHRNLLQWQTAEEADRTAVNTISGLYRQMWFSPLFAVLCILLLWHHAHAFLYALPLIVAWLTAPAIVWYINRPVPAQEPELTRDDYAFLHRIARKTWYFFETFVNKEDNYLPPDNFQEIPSPVIATRTSPTNIGLSLLANVSAHDFGYLSVNGMIERVHNTFLTLTRLKKYRGHFYNWYDTRTLEPLYPLYISSVDSGNLAGNLITLAQAFRQQVDKPVYTPVLFEGLLDTLRILRELSPADTTLLELEELLSAVELPGTLPRAYTLLKQVRDEAERFQTHPGSDKEELINWAETFLANCNDHLNDLLYLFPWLEKDYTIFLTAMRRENEKATWLPILENLFTGTLSLQEMTDWEESLLPYIKEAVKTCGLNQEPDPVTDGWEEDLNTMVQRAATRRKILESMALQSDGLSRMDFKFLYSEKKKLFTIGYSVMEQRYDDSSYDILASEARLCSYITIARGQVPVDHWFAMSRLLVLLRGNPVLLSWSGSMFEYLMPLLLMPTYKETLLDQTYQGSVQEQIDYAGKYRIPWGISESGYNRPDTRFNYQYQAFGVPSLGLKRGLSKDLVIAPYATMLALMVNPRKAYENLRRLTAEGQEGRYGYYEAIDYTPSHLPLNEKKVTIFSFMAHHQGMGLLALTNLMKNNSMQKRFIGNPQMKAFELLLQERAPHNVATNAITDNSRYEIRNLHALNEYNPHADRIYTTGSVPAQVNLLSNSRYQLMINSSGAGYSRWNNIAVTRWRQDFTSDTGGLFIYLRDVNTGHYWSAGYQPACTPLRDYEAHFTQAYAEFRHRHTGLDVVTNICISPEDDVELRCLKITNHSHQERTIELTTYAEVVITQQGADEAHPVFSNLFVQTHFNSEIPALFCTRRARSQEEQPPHLFHMMLVDEAFAGEFSFETDRSLFVGRGNTLSNPLAMQSPEPLSGSQGSVLDPIVSLRRTVTIPSGKTLRICVALGMAVTQESAYELAEKYQNVRMTDRAFDLAWTHSQVVLYHLNIRETEAQLYQKLAGSLLYINPAYRADTAIQKNNKRGQNSLWGYGISGDVPLVLLRISGSSGMELLRQLILAHAYWRIKGITSEMLVLHEDTSVYRHPMHEQIIGIISSSVEAPLLDKPGGIVVRPLEQVSAEDLILLQATASMIFNDKEGSFADQAGKERGADMPAALLQPATPLIPEKKKEEVQLPAVETLYNNSFGGFSADGKEYIITVEPGRNTPAPWSNVLANPTFGTVISESGSSYTWCENAHEYRLTPWNNDPVKDSCGEAIYIRDEESGHYWSPTPLPAKGTTPYTIRHGFGYSVFEHIEEGIASELWVYVAIDAPVKFSVLKLRNLSGRSRRLTVTGYYEWVLGDTRTRNQLHVVTQVDPVTGVLYARNYYNTDFAEKIAFADIGLTRRITGDRTEFLGIDGHISRPQAMERKRLSGKTGAGADPCGAVQTVVELDAAQQKKVIMRLGCARSEEDLITLVNRYRQAGSVTEALCKVQDYWNKTLGTIAVSTPDPAINIMANGWLLYQSLSCRIWARSGYYQSGGAYGFRDQLQDVMALVHAEPALTRQQIILAAHRQFKKGDVQHWWHPPVNRGVRTLFSDDYLWLPYVTHHYITAVGDKGVLDEVIPFLEGRELNPGEESYYDLPIVSNESGTLYEHCVRSIRYGLKFGIHGLPLMGCGDWNDGMNLIGIQGKGESVWLGFFLYDVLIKFSKIATLYGDSSFAEFCTGQAGKLQENIRNNAWDGNWYRRAYFDDGTPLGSSQNSECTIDALPQSWSVISGAGDPERSLSGMTEVSNRLVDRKLKLIRLFTPSFDKFLPNPGYIKGYIPGVRENGGQYTHGVIWTAIAFATMGENDRAWELFDLLNPINHGSNAQEVSMYKIEPYVVAADIYTAEQHPGRGGWSWYTGSSAWLYRLLVETLLGINRVGESLHLQPRMRKEWTEYQVSYRYYDTTYQITFKRITGDSTPGLILDGKLIPEADTFSLVNDGEQHTVEMSLR